MQFLQKFLMAAAFMQKIRSNVEKNQIYETLYRDLNFVENLN